MLEIERDIRRIVREEIREALRTMAVAVGDAVDYDADIIEGISARMVGRVAEATAGRMEHAAQCPSRNSVDYWRACNCDGAE